MPYVQGMFEAVAKKYQSEYYGYINSDILLSFNIFEILELCRANAAAGSISRRVAVSTRREA